MDFLQKIKNKLNKKNKKTSTTNESYLNTEVVYNVKDNFIILISFTEDYFYSVMEFLSYRRTYLNLNIQLADSICSEVLEEIDAFGDNIRIIHNKYYLLIGGESAFYNNLFRWADNMANFVIQAIITEIYNNRTSSDFKTLIDHGILVEDKFKYKNVKPDYDHYANENVPKTHTYDDASLIMSRIPDCFTGQNLLKFIHCYQFGEESDYYTAIDIIYKAYADGNSIFQLLIERDFKDLYHSLVKNPTKEILMNFIGPQYLVESAEAITGDISDDQLDDIFKQQYDRFTAIKDDSIVYEDIDEKLPPNAESENIRKSDVIDILSRAEEGEV